MTDWLDIQKRVEAGESMTSSGELHGMDIATISRRAKAEGWLVAGNTWIGRINQLDDVRTLIKSGEQRRKVAEALARMASGDTMAVALRIVSIAGATFRGWMAGSPQLSLMVDEARAETETRLLGSIRNKAEGDWKAASWYLGRLRPAEFGQVDSAIAPKITIAIDLAPPRAPDPIDITDDVVRLDKPKP